MFDARGDSGRLTTIRRQSYIIVALVFAVAGILLLGFTRTSVDWPLVLGTSLLGTGLISTVWQIAVGRWQRESTVDALRTALRQTQPSLGLVETRIGEMPPEEFQERLSRTDRLSAVCLYDKRLTESWRPARGNFLSRGGKVRLCAPDPDDHILMAALARRHNEDNPCECQQSVRKVLSAYSKLARKFEDQVEVRVCSAPGPSYTCYLFEAPNQGGSGSTRMYDHDMEEGLDLSEQTFLQTGLLFRHYLSDFERLWSSALAYRQEIGPSEQSTIAVIGPGNSASVDDLRIAREVGKKLAEAGAHVICGGLSGVMAAAAQGVKESGGKVLGVLPGLDRQARNRFLDEDEVEATGLGEARNFKVIDRSDAVIAVGCNPGTLIETSYAFKMGKPVFSLNFWKIMDGLNEVNLTEPVDGLDDAVSKALAASGRSVLTRSGSTVADE